jgi:hypothetical protein
MRCPFRKRGDMTYSDRSSRYRGSRKRLARIRFSRQDKWLAVLIALLSILAMVVGGWLGANYQD